MKLTDFESGMKKYEQYMQFNSAHSIKQVRMVANKLKEFLVAMNWGDDEITPDTILTFRTYLKEYKISTINQYLKVLKTTFSWLLEMGYWNGGNPVKSAFFIKEKPKEYDCILTEEEMYRIEWARTKKKHTGRNLLAFYRRKAIVLTLITSAIRCNELAGIRLQDIDWKNHSIRILEAKGGKPRTVLLHNCAKRAIKNYLEKARPQNATQADYLFLMPDKNGNFRRIPPRTIEHDVARYIEEVTGRKGVFPHALRHTSASYMISAGMPIAEIQAILGHSSIKMTEHYAKLLAPDVTPVRSADKVFSKIYNPYV